MRSWLTAQQIATLSLPGIPGTRRGVLDLADREGWMTKTSLVRPSQQRGGGVEFHADLLPAEARGAMAAQAIGKVAVPDLFAEQAAAEPDAGRLSVPAAEHRDARLALLAACARFRAESGLGQLVSDQTFAAKYNLGMIPVDAWIRQAVAKLAPRSLHRWRAAVQDGSISRLAVDHGAKRRGKGALRSAAGGEVETYCLALIARQPHLSADHVRTLVADRFPIIDLPAARTFRHQLKAWRETHAVALARITNPDLFKSRYRVAGRNAHPVSRLNELWMIDASPADVLTTEGRHAIYVAIDIFSRRQSLMVTRTPRAEAVGLLMRKAMLAWGVPERLKTDNGSDFVAKFTKRLFASLGIEVDVASPFSPEQKGHVERAIGTLQRDLMPLLPGFVGHSVADRKVIEERRAFAARLGDTDANAFCVDLSAAELQEKCDAWASNRYAHRPHDGLNGNTPFKVAAGFAGTIRRVDLRALDVLLAPIAGRDGLRTVTKSGIRIDGSHYLTPTVLPETRVLVRMDPADMGRATLFSEDGETFLGEAVCPDLAGIDPAQAVAQARAAQKAILDAGTADIRRAMRSIKPRDMVDAVLRQAAKDSGVLVELPRRSEAHTTPALEAAAQAAGAADVVGFPAPVRPESHPAPEGVTVLHPRDTPQLRFRRALAMREEIAAGRAVPPADASWFLGYAEGSEYQAMQAIYEDFGEAALR